ncbi:lysophospholipid acyltransferase family protein [Blastopirellula sp. JC732]|uniref:Lysophospholipid acyltransferase family protein n=1 Tax=Blastopirellula sediminis TaxID=2894196 RepID=A0A9X1MR96_9BACT|nr:lysophospholipid acyltransferase family protein [Blastopirellula sediminis]MCC9604788.1 lysophospholipid acyltransferase family protein [Blastopirellula sediminis]MCC9631913.1 lysophospholipid acyltransferase family protein [Blastopirellula sediminis]
MALEYSWLTRLGGFALQETIRHWLDTLDLRVAYHDARLDPSHPENNQAGIYIFWHEYISFPLYLRPYCNIAMLLSKHRDAEWLAHTAQMMGFDTVRGSSQRGGATALMELLEKSKSMHLAITPDGPRGPRRRLAPGAIYLASRLGLPLIPMGFGFDRPTRARTWDKFAIPRFFSRGRGLMGAALWIPPKLDKEEIEQHRRRVQRYLNKITAIAEDWAESGLRLEQEIAARPRSAPLAGHRQAAKFDPFWIHAEARSLDLSEEKLERQRPTLVVNKAA